MRLGRPGAAGDFEPPVIINQGKLNRQSLPPARDITAIHTRSGRARLVAVDRSSDTLSVYTLGRTGAVVNYTRLVAPAGSLLARASAAI